MVIGNNETRKKIQSLLEMAGASIPILINPSTTVGEKVEMGAGTILMAGLLSIAVVE